MSRTYRRDAVLLDCHCGAPIGWHWRLWWSCHEYKFDEQEAARELKQSLSRGLPPDRMCHCWTNRRYSYYSKRNYKRDNKPWNKSAAWFKRSSQRSRRAKIKKVMAHGDYENIPKFKKDNDWNWS